jgi:hypothetical protein
MEEGVDMKGCVREEARPGRNVWGGWLPIFWGGILIDEKNREMGGPFALDGPRLMEGHNNQPKVNINDGRGIEEERRPGRNMGGGGCLFAWSGKSTKKNNNNENTSWP